MNLKEQKVVSSILAMDGSIQAIEFLVNQSGLDDELLSLLTILSNSLRSSFTELIPLLLAYNQDPEG